MKDEVKEYGMTNNQTKALLTAIEKLIEQTDDKKAVLKAIQEMKKEL